jgi:D,D-heptose 1,7-bisphosphate phosphatase
MSTRAVFIDKDGTLVQNIPYNVDPARLSFMPKAIAGLQQLRDAGYDIVVITNQSGIARGIFDESAFLHLAAALSERLRNEGVSLAGLYYCGHHPDGTVPRFAVSCGCRKPAPGLFTYAATELAIDLAGSYAVGDILDDVEAGRRAGIHSGLILSGGETEWRPGPYRVPDFVARDLVEAAEQIRAHAQTSSVEVRNAG